MGLDPQDYGRRFPHELSGGERQRVGVARALGADPPVLLMDEPFGAVDPVTRQRLQNQFLELQRQLKKSIVFVTHDIEEAAKLGDRIAVLSKGGVLEQYDTPAEILGRPATPFVADFVGTDRGVRAWPWWRSRRRPGPAPDGRPHRHHGRGPASGTTAEAKTAVVVATGSWLGWIPLGRDPTGPVETTSSRSPPRSPSARPCEPPSARCSCTTCAGCR